MSNSTQPLAILYYAALIPGSQLANQLQDFGYRVNAAVDAATLYETCQQLKPLVVVAEIAPGSPALESVAKLRKDPATQHIPVLGYSASQDPAHLNNARVSGVTLMAGTAAISEHLARLLEQVLTVE